MIYPYTTTKKSALKRCSYFIDPAREIQTLQPQMLNYNNMKYYLLIKTNWKSKK